MTQELSSKSSKIFVEFDYGTTPERFTNVATRQVTPFGTFESDTKLEVTLPTYTGALKESVATIRFDGSSAFAQRVTDGRIFPPTTVTVWELESGYLVGSPDQLLTKLRYLFCGGMQTSKLNPNGVEGLCQIDASVSKTELNYSLGYQANNECDFTLGDPHTCKANISPFFESTVVTSIDGLIVEASGISQPWPNIWDRGYISKDGIKLLIRFRDGVTDFFHVAKLPPLEWVGQTVTFIPGCRKSEASCLKWQNLGNFLGAGIGIPDRHPVFENGS